MLLVTILAGPDKGSVHRLSDQEVHVIGRRRGSVPLADQSISRQHARLHMQNGHWYATDLDSVNGTCLNDEPLDEPTQLQSGDRIEIGRSLLECQVVTDDQARAMPPEAGPGAEQWQSFQDQLAEVLEEVRQVKASASTSPDADSNLQQQFTDLITEVRQLKESAAAPTDDRTPALLGQILDRLDNAPAAPTDDRTPALLGQVLDRLDNAPAAIPVEPVGFAPDPEMQGTLQQILDAVNRPASPAPAGAGASAESTTELKQLMQDVLDAVRQGPAAPAADPEAQGMLSEILQNTREQARESVPGKLDALLQSVGFLRERAAAASDNGRAPDFEKMSEELTQVRAAIDALPGPIDPAPKLREVLEAQTAESPPQILDQIKQVRESFEGELGRLRQSLDRLAEKHDAPAAAAGDAAMAEKMEAFGRQMQEQGEALVTELKKASGGQAKAVEIKALLTLVQRMQDQQSTTTSKLAQLSELLSRTLKSMAMASAAAAINPPSASAASSVPPPAKTMAPPKQKPIASPPPAPRPAPSGANQPLIMPQEGKWV